MRTLMAIIYLPVCSILRHVIAQPPHNFRIQTFRLAALLWVVFGAGSIVSPERTEYNRNGPR